MSKSLVLTFNGVTVELSWFLLANMAVAVILVVYLTAEIIRAVRRRGSRNQE